MILDLVYVIFVAFIALHPSGVGFIQLLAFSFLVPMIDFAAYGMTVLCADRFSSSMNS